MPLRIFPWISRNNRICDPKPVVGPGERPRIPPRIPPGCPSGLEVVGRRAVRQKPNDPPDKEAGFQSSMHHFAFRIFQFLFLASILANCQFLTSPASQSTTDPQRNYALSISTCSTPVYWMSYRASGYSTVIVPAPGCAAFLWFNLGFAGTSGLVA